MEFLRPLDTSMSGGDSRQLDLHTNISEQDQLRLYQASRRYPFLQKALLRAQEEFREDRLKAGSIERLIVAADLTFAKEKEVSLRVLRELQLDPLQVDFEEQLVAVQEEPVLRRNGLDPRVQLALRAVKYAPFAGKLDSETEHESYNRVYMLREPETPTPFAVCKVGRYGDSDTAVLEAAFSDLIDALGISEWFLPTFLETLPLMEGKHLASVQKFHDGITLFDYMERVRKSNETRELSADSYFPLVCVALVLGMYDMHRRNILLRFDSDGKPEFKLIDLARSFAHGIRVDRGKRVFTAFRCSFLKLPNSFDPVETAPFLSIVDLMEARLGTFKARLRELRQQKRIQELPPGWFDARSIYRGLQERLGRLGRVLRTRQIKALSPWNLVGCVLPEFVNERILLLYTKHFEELRSAQRIVDSRVQEREIEWLFQRTASASFNWEGFPTILSSHDIPVRVGQVLLRWRREFFPIPKVRYLFGAFPWTRAEIPDRERYVAALRAENQDFVDGLWGSSPPDYKDFSRAHVAKSLPWITKDFCRIHGLLYAPESIAAEEVDADFNRYDDPYTIYTNVEGYELMPFALTRSELGVEKVELKIDFMRKQLILKGIDFPYLHAYLKCPLLRAAVASPYFSLQREGSRWEIFRQPGGEKDLFVTYKPAESMLIVFEKTNQGSIRREMVLRSGTSQVSFPGLSPMTWESYSSRFFSS